MKKLYGKTEYNNIYIFNLKNECMHKLEEISNHEIFNSHDTK